MEGRSREAAWAWLLAACAGLALASPAGATVTCARTGTTLKLTADQPGDTAIVSSDMGDLVANSDTLPCSGAPTTTNVDLIRLRDVSGGSTNLRVSGGDEALAPGATEAGDEDPGFFINPDEIEVKVRMGPGRNDNFSYSASALEDEVVWGEDGINFNPRETLGTINDADVSVTGAEELELSPGNDPDVVTAGGGFATGPALRDDLTIIDYFGGDDMYTGGDGDDLIIGGPGADVLSGGKGADSVEYLDSGSGPDPDVRASIGVGTGDDGGEDDGPLGSRDTIKGSVEGLIGDNGDDILIGDGDSNKLIGRRGRDKLLGRAGSDDLRAQDGIKDKRINCGAGGGEKALVDAKDPNPISC